MKRANDLIGKRIVAMEQPEFEHFGTTFHELTRLITEDGSVYEVYAVHDHGRAWVDIVSRSNPGYRFVLAR